MKKSPNTSRYLQKQKDMKQAAIDFAINRIPIQEVMVKYKVSYASVYNAIERFNIPYTKTYGRAIFFDENYFENIDSEHKAYWLGFLFADGTILKTDKNVSQPNRVILSLALNDIEHVRFFANDINMPLECIKQRVSHGFGHETQCVTLHCNSIKMCQDLQKLGYTLYKVERKSIPTIHADLRSHFIRGYFDADGCIWGNYKRGAFEMQSSGTVVLDILDTLMKECNLPTNKTIMTKNSYRFKYGGRQQILRIGTYLYQNATIFLTRKLLGFVNRCFRNESDYISNLDS